MYCMSKGFLPLCIKNASEFRPLAIVNLHTNATVAPHLISDATTSTTAKKKKKQKQKTKKKTNKCFEHYVQGSFPSFWWLSPVLQSVCVWYRWAKERGWQGRYNCYFGFMMKCESWRSFLCHIFFFRQHCCFCLFIILQLAKDFDEKKRKEFGSQLCMPIIREGVIF